MSDIDNDTKAKALYTCLGAIEGLHTNLDSLRDRNKMLGAYPSDLDYNIEHAQQALEIASMRLQQAARIVVGRLPGESEEPQPQPTVKATCSLCHRGVVWHPGNGGQWIGDTPPQDWMTCYGRVDGPYHRVEGVTLG